MTTTATAIVPRRRRIGGFWEFDTDRVATAEGKYLAEWLWDLQDEPFQYTAIMRAILEIPKPLSNRREQRRDQNGFCAVAKRR